MEKLGKEYRTQILAFTTEVCATGCLLTHGLSDIHSQHTQPFKNSDHPASTEASEDGVTALEEMRRVSSFTYFQRDFLLFFFSFVAFLFLNIVVFLFHNVVCVYPFVSRCSRLSVLRS